MNMCCDMCCDMCSLFDALPFSSAALPTVDSKHGTACVVLCKISSKDCQKISVTSNLVWHSMNVAQQFLFILLYNSGVLCYILGLLWTTRRETWLNWSTPFHSRRFKRCRQNWPKSTALCKLINQRGEAKFEQNNPRELFKGRVTLFSTIALLVLSLVMYSSHSPSSQL